MSFNEQVSFQLYPDSSAADFTISDFYFVRPEYIQVNVYTPAGTVINKTQPADWTIDGKTITRVTVWEAGEVLVTRGNLYNQLNTWRNAEIDFDRELMEWTMDYITMLTQQNQDLYQKAIHAPLFDTANWFELPIVAVRSGKFMTFDGNGDLVTRELNSADIGAANIKWLSASDYAAGGDEWIVYHGEELWQAVSGGPVVGVAPSPALPLQWTLISRNFLKDNNWQNDIDYPAGTLVGYSGQLWKAVAAVVAEAPGAVVGNWYEMALGIKENPLWNAGVAYDQNDIVNYGGGYYICSDAGGSDISVAPADGAGKWERWSGKTTENVTSTPVTITSGRMDHICFIDTTTAGSIVAVTLSDGFVKKDTVTLVVLGTYSLTVAGTGLTGETIPIETTKSYIWDGTAWVQYSSTEVPSSAINLTTEVLNTTTGNIAASIPGSPSTNDVYEVWNVGTGDFHVTGLPNSITLGDGKGIKFRYISGSWRYEDVIIDEYVATSSEGTVHTITKWAGGRMTVSATQSLGTTQQTLTFAEPFIAIPVPNSTGLDGGARYSHCFPTSATSVRTSGRDGGGGLQAVDRSVVVNGRWKVGV